VAIRCFLPISAHFPVSVSFTEQDPVVVTRLDKTSSWSADHPVSFRDDLTRFRSSRQDRRVRQRCREGRRAAMPVLTNFVIV
ncbi:MAG TPA: hypothetical protein VGJ06_15805, partial [Candidatus Acidoferrum sp.]